MSHLINKYLFDVIAVSESRIIKNEPSIVYINLPDYSYEFCPTESSAGSTLLYIGNHHSCKLFYSLGPKLYKPCDFESTFIEISNNKKN